MLTIKRLNARGQNAAGEDVVEYLLNTDVVVYYGPNGQPIADGPKTMWWSGGMADTLGLTGKDVVKDDMMALAQGFAPDGAPLCKNAGEKPTIEIKRDRHGNAIKRSDGTDMTLERGGHRVGFDITFTPPKSIGLIYMLGDEETRRIVQECMMEAVDVQCRFLETKLETRRGAGGKDAIGVKSTVRSHHVHEANRNLEPSPHVHTLWYNVCEGEDGQMSTYDAVELFRWRHAADMLGQTQLATLLHERLGVSIHQHEHIDIHGKRTGRKGWEIAGLHDRDLIEAVSSRHREIMAERAKGTSDAEAWAKTRKHKNEPGHDELMNHFAKLRAQLAQDHALPTLAELQQQKFTRVAARSEEELLKFLHEKQSILDQPTVMKHLGMEDIGFQTSEQMLAKMDAFQSSGAVVAVNPMAVHEDDTSDKPANRYRELRYAATWMLETEQRFVHAAKEREQETWLQVEKGQAERSIARMVKKKGFAPSEEQRRVIEHATVESKGIAVVPGFAGTGKTTTSDFIKAVFEDDGRTLIGCAVGNKAAQKLERETGIECRSVTKTLSMIKKGKLMLDNKSVVVLDEAGMINIHQSQELATVCKEAGAKLLVQGDTRQLQPVGAGMGMSLLEDVLPTAQLTEIRRQKKEEDRRIALMFYGAEDGKAPSRKGVMSRQETTSKSRAIFDELERRGSIEEYTKRSDGLELVVQKYIQKNVPDDEFLVMTHTLLDLKDVNNAIREARKQRGDVVGKEATFKAMGKEDFYDLTVAKGDKLSFTKADSVMKVINGTEATVTNVEENRRRGGFNITVRMDEDGRELTFNTHEWKAVKLSYARTVHDAQGQGKREVVLFGDAGMSDVSSVGVAFTRMTDGSFSWIVSTEQLDYIRDNLGRERFTENILQSGVANEEVNRIFSALKTVSPSDDIEALLPKTPSLQPGPARSMFKLGPPTH